MEKNEQNIPSGSTISEKFHDWLFFKTDGSRTSLSGFRKYKNMPLFFKIQHSWEFSGRELHP